MIKKKYTNLIVPIVIGIIIFSLIIMKLFINKGFNTNYALAITGGDDTSFMAEIKSMVDGSSYLRPEYLGAPFGTNRTNNLSYYLFNDVHIINYLWAMITGSIAVAQWLTYITMIFLNFISAYIVLVSRKINTYVCIGAALLFAFQYYVRVRSIGHIMLTSLWTIPLYVLLCLWIIDSDDYLKIGKSFIKNKRNIYAIIISALVINSGIGYYPFFGCMYIIMTGTIKSIYYKKFIGFIQALKQIIIIIFFELINLSYYIYSVITRGNTGIKIRSVADGEIYGLKIIDLFINPRGIGISRIDDKINEFMKYALAHYEVTSYLGYIGIVSLVIILIMVFSKRLNNKLTDADLIIKLIIMSVLYGTVGGFSVFVFLFVTDGARCTNRISVFIYFLCLYLCSLIIMKMLDYIKTKSKILKDCTCIILVIFCFFTLQDQFLIYGNYENSGTKEKTLVQEEFIHKIENSVPENAMVFQLPFSDYPTSGKIEEMMPDEMFSAYIFSNSIHWSYGTYKGEDSYIWNKYVSELEVNEMLNNLCYMGFEGIYIDSYGYNSEDYYNLTNGLSYFISEDSMIISDDERWIFYNLEEYSSVLRDSMTEAEWDAKVDYVNNKMVKDIINNTIN